MDHLAACNQRVILRAPGLPGAPHKAKTEAYLGHPHVYIVIGLNVIGIVRIQHGPR